MGRMTQGKQGFTLIETVVVLAVLGILLGIAAPRMTGYLERARISADLATVGILNAVTPVFRAGAAPVDPFGDGSVGSGDLLGVLTDAGYLSSVPRPQHRDAEFLWNPENERWLYSLLAVADESRKHYLFADMSTDDFLYNSWGGGGGATWSVTGEGLYTTGTGNNDLLFIGNNRNEYTLTTTFRLEENPDARGGMGIFFETVLNGDSQNRDTGYILQFDRGFSEVILRRRVNGTESNSSDMLLARIGNRSSSTIRNETIPYRTDSDWWESEKALSLTVRESGQPGIKILTVSLDGEVLLQDFELESSIGAPNNHTGYRAWNGSPVTIYALTVE